MAGVLLQGMLEEIRLENLPAAWIDFDPASFSREKRLWDYQQRAVENAVRALWKYYEDFGEMSTKSRATGIREAR